MVLNIESSIFNGKNKFIIIILSIINPTRKITTTSYIPNQNNKLSIILNFMLPTHN